MRYPEFLPQGGTLHFTAPAMGSAGPQEARLQLSVDTFEAMGFHIIETEDCRKEEGLGISASPEECGTELMDAYLSPDSQAVISCGGGELMCRDLDYIDFDAVSEAEPKWFMGYSDNTNFGFLLPTICDVASIYGPNAGSFGMDPWHPVLDDAMGILTGQNFTLHNYDGHQATMFLEHEEPSSPYLITEPYDLKIFAPDDADPDASIEMSGRLIGGCLDCLVNLLGTCYDNVEDFLERYREDGFIWFLEACDLNVWGLTRALWQMEHAGWLKYVNGFLFGRPLAAGEPSFGLDEYNAVLEILGKYNVPILMDADLGHLPPSMPLISGSYAHIAAGDNELEVTMELI